MKTLSPGLAVHLAGGVTTLARCWTLTRRDGVTMGFTDHDRDILLDGVPHQARSGLEAAEARQEAGFSAESVDILGALQSAGVTERDIASGFYDAALVTTHLVDWSDPSNRVVLGRHVIGEVRRTQNGFVAELRSQAHAHDEEKGRVYTTRCDAELGDSRCRVAIAPAAASVMLTDGRSSIVTAELQAHSAGRFAGGRLTFTGGANAGVSVELREHAVEAGLSRLELWLEAPHDIAVGDPFTVTPGCNKSFATCRAVFGNAINFQGFPHIPGGDFLLRRAAEGEPQLFDGGSLFR